MNKPDNSNTRITLERVTVTTIRRRTRLPVYCAMCQREIDLISRGEHDAAGPKPLAAGEEQFSKTGEKEK